MLSSVFGCCYSERSKQLADNATTITDAPVKAHTSNGNESDEDDDSIIKRVTFRRDGNTPRSHYDGNVPPVSEDLEDGRKPSTSFPAGSTHALVRGFSFPERMLSTTQLPKPALVRRSSFTTDGKKDPNPAFAGKNVRFQLPGGVSDGSDSEDSDTDEREAAKQKALGLQVRDVQGEQPHPLPSPGNAVGVTTVSTNGLPTLPAPMPYQTPAASNDHEDEDLDVKVVGTPAPQDSPSNADNDTTGGKAGAYTPYNTLSASFNGQFQAGAIPPPNGLPKRDMDGNELKTPAPSVLPASPPGTLTTQQAQNLTTTASTTVNNMATPPPVVSVPAGTAAPTTGPVTESPSNKVPPPLPDAPRPQLLAPPEPKKAPPVPKKPIPNPATPAKDAIRPNPWRFVSSGKLSDKYELTDVTLGSGAFGVVKVAHLKDDENQLFAVKIIPKTNSLLTEEEFLEEVDIISKLHHPHIIALQDMYETDQNVYLVMELASGGELFDRLIEEKKIDEREARQVAFQMFEAIAYLHSSGIIHRDLKPENILFKTPVKFSAIKITDFGFAKHLANNKQEMKARAKRGTMGYAAPEIFSNQPYDEKCDIWSAAIIVYIMLCGAPPFVELPPVEEGLRKPFWKLANPKKKTPDPNEKVEFPIEYWAGVSEDARSFLRSALEVNPLQRPRAIDLLKHRWIKNQSKMNATQTFVASEPLPWMMQNAKHSMR